MLRLKMFTLKYVPGAVPGKALKDFCDDFISEDDNWNLLLSYSKE